ncbi:hypothetical protein SAMN05192588_1678 [Nonlabens sp. Hel1_33_55]|uniref:hypothetical protein n=1 Tax=Nonlabens sp. Hel1_33_55 TaxID=1336802 RepID=UPI000875E848|nr:hypothetical protein [Nonlabens sp. Hel1_33_55]SCY20925.1 hypothetical protein SAMN05192588_1678 [Nonlabens sp. Hel1_33_55]
MKNIIVCFLLISQLIVAQEKPKETETATAENTVELNTTYYSLPSGEVLTDSGLIYVTVGSMTGYLSEFELFFRNHLIDTYNIGYKFYGCSVTGSELAEMTKRNNDIKDVYGENFLSVERSKAKELFDKGI